MHERNGRKKVKEGDYGFLLPSSTTFPYFHFKRFSLILSLAQNLVRIGLNENYLITHLNLRVNVTFGLLGPKGNQKTCQNSNGKVSPQKTKVIVVAMLKWRSQYDWLLFALLQKLHEYNQDDPVEVPVPLDTVNPSNTWMFTVNDPSGSP